MDRAPLTSAGASWVLFTCRSQAVLFLPFSKDFPVSWGRSTLSLHPLDVFPLTCRAGKPFGGALARVALHLQAPVELWFHRSAGLSWHSPSTKWFVCAGLFFLRAELVWALLIVLPQPTSGLGTLRASSGCAYGSQQEFCQCPWHFLMKGSVFAVPPSPLLLTQSVQVVYSLETGCQ